MISTRSGWIGGEEVVEVGFDPQVIPFDALCEFAERRDCARAFDAAIRPEDPKYYLSRTPLRFLPMTELQAMRINARIEADGLAKACAVLTASQRALLAEIVARPDAGWPSAIGVEIREAWDRAAGLRAFSGSR